MKFNKVEGLPIVGEVISVNNNEERELKIVLDSPMGITNNDLIEFWFGKYKCNHVMISEDEK